MLRSILSLVLGFATTLVAVILANLVLFSILGLDWEDPTGGVLASYIGVTLLGGFSAGVVSGKVAERRPFTHAAVLAAIVLVQSVWGALATSVPGAAWYPWLLTVLGPLSVLAGGWLVAERTSPAGHDTGAAPIGS